MRHSVLGPGNWARVLKEEQEFQARQKEQRERRIAKTILANVGDDDFTFHTLCERFSESHPETIRRILHTCDVEVSSDGSTLCWIHPKLAILH